MTSPASRSDAFVPGPRGFLPPTASGRLSGLRFAVKDLIDIEGFVTGAGNPDWRAGRGPAAASAPVVTILRAAGAAFVGQTVTDELAFSLEGANVHDGTPPNPAAPDRLPGGSSSGSAAAVAGGAAEIALGTDTGGSVRVPAAFCGLYGMRPTHGQVSLDGVVPFAPSYDTVGWFARDAGTLARAAESLLGAASGPPITRFLVVEDAFALADADLAQALLAVLLPALAGAERVRVFAEGAGAWREAYRILQGAEIWRSLGPWITRMRPRFGPSIAERFADAAGITDAEVARWQPVRLAIRARVRGLLAPGTALVVPTAPTPALPRNPDAATLGDFYARALPLTAIAGHSGLPQITLPVARLNGAPIGLSLIGADGADAALIAAGQTLFGGRPLA
ncbi:amidase [Methylobacterium sp. WL64]|uniref:amidase n=1 Tax=Methylobacterium sp. WL64 TaxID=2603894 RepID=UPI0011C98B1B|nr:amidase [Methylobacterium sp. WL64]TXM98856.1 amidase [Methylobacterium sp. WL64]